ncbi:MBL fold metallo-hydrolase [Puniceibacterium confluentis]|uniref:MBL fold metallo-hydrolase n=2 Tax=Puniceibacterium confluentis TaxID=1958944 RepID=UPI0011B6EC30|nr:MBL fold metallo-hydrolase [Puniceibacterium confluentis]
MFTRTSPSTGPNSPRVDGFYESDTGSVQYVVSDPETKQAALIDIVQDFDPASGRTAYRSAQTALDFVRDNGLEVVWILDTHPHADHLMAQSWLKQQTGAPTGIGEKVHEIAGLWSDIYNMPNGFDPDRDFDHLFSDGAKFKLGNLDVRVILSPGHTLGSITYVIGDAALVHDTFMHVDAGTTRADFPGGSSSELYASLQRILDLPDDTRLFVGHDYPPVGDRKDPAWEATVADHRANNKHIGGGVSESEFRKLRDARDATLDLPDRMLHALQVNLRGGRLPEPEGDGRSYFKIPANHFTERNT